MSKQLMGDTKGVCYNCLNGFHKGCDKQNCTCHKAKHVTWWWKEMGLQNEINDWAEKTFGKLISNSQMATRANEEMAELLKCLAINDKDPNALEECADIVICIYRLAHNLGGSLHDAITKKMGKNYKTKFNTNGKGTGYHKK